MFVAKDARIAELKGELAHTKQWAMNPTPDNVLWFLRAALGIHTPVLTDPQQNLVDAMRALIQSALEAAAEQARHEEFVAIKLVAGAKPWRVISNKNDEPWYADEEGRTHFTEPEARALAAKLNAQSETKVETSPSQTTNTQQGAEEARKQ